MNPDQVLEIYKKTGALLEGHFQLTSGMHTDQYLQSALVLQHPQHAEALGAALAERFRETPVDLVVGPAMGGVILAHTTGRALGVRAFYTERKEGTLIFYRGFQVRPGERVLVVEDVVTTGGSARETAEVIRAHQGRVVGVGAIVDRSGGAVRFDVPYQSLLVLTVPGYRPADCPLCRKGIAVVTPGSRGLS